MVMTKGTNLGEFEQIVLLAVARLDGEGYGMTIRREIQERSGRDVSIGAVYATLERLEAKGYVGRREGEPTPVRGGRSRRFFSLEPSGARALQASREVMDRMWDGLRLGAGEG